MHEEEVAQKEVVILTLQTEIDELRAQQNEKLEAYVTQIKEDIQNTIQDETQASSALEQSQ